MIDPTIVNSDVLKYVFKTIPEQLDVFNQIEEQARREYRPIISKDVGQFLHLLTKITNAKRILEIGCNIGYSGSWFASALPENGHLDTLEIDPKIAKLAEINFEKARVKNKVTVHVGAALETIPNLDYQYDILFIDAAKKQYTDYVKVSMPKLKKGALILVDNVLWSGRVAKKEIEKGDKITQSLKDFNDFFMSNTEIEATILTVGDGIAFGIKK